MKRLQVTLAILTCAVGSAVSASEPQKVDVKREIGELKTISRTILIRLERLESRLDPSKPTQRNLLDLRFRTPKQTFETLQKALAKKKWRTAVACYTPSARNEIAKAFVLLSAFATMRIEDKDRRVQYAKDLQKLNAKHFPPTSGEANRLDVVGEVLRLALSKWIVEGDIPDNIQEATVRTVLRQIAARQALAKSELTKFVKRIRDRDAYLAAVLALIVEYGDSPMDYSSHQLVDIKMSGNVAQGFLVAMGKPRKRITFIRVGRAWRVDQSK